MKNRILYAILLCAITMAVSACGGNSSVEIRKDQPAEQSGEASEEKASEEKKEADAPEVTDAYFFTVDGFAIAPDMDMSLVLEKIGKEKSYFEAESCAFQGLDKMYTYADFEIDTYPQGDKDLISAILLKDDLVETDEGVAIGESLSDIEAAYGSAKAEDGTVTFTKGNMKLVFILEGDSIASIEYDSITAQQQ